MASAMICISNYDSSPFMIAISREMSDDPNKLAAGGVGKGYVEGAENLKLNYNVERKH